MEYRRDSLQEKELEWFERHIHGNWFVFVAVDYEHSVADDFYGFDVMNDDDDDEVFLLFHIHSATEGEIFMTSMTIHSKLTDPVGGCE